MVGEAVAHPAKCTGETRWLQSHVLEGHNELAEPLTIAYNMRVLLCHIWSKPAYDGATRLAPIVWSP